MLHDGMLGSDLLMPVKFTSPIQFAAIFLAVKGIQNVKDAANESGGFDASDVFTNTSEHLELAMIR